MSGDYQPRQPMNYQGYTDSEIDRVIRVWRHAIDKLDVEIAELMLVVDSRRSAMKLRQVELGGLIDERERRKQAERWAATQPPLGEVEL